MLKTRVCLCVYQLCKNSSCQIDRASASVKAWGCLGEVGLHACVDSMMLGLGLQRGWVEVITGPGKQVTPADAGRRHM